MTDAFDLIEGKEWDTIRCILENQEEYEDDDYDYEYEDEDDVRTILTSFLPKNFNRYGLNPFHVLCSASDAPVDILTLLVKKDGDFLTTKAIGSNYAFDATPLHFACESGSIQTVKTLLRLKSSSYSSKKSITPQAQHKKMKMYASQKDGHGNTVLDVAWFHHLDPDYVLYTGDANDEKKACKHAKQVAEVASLEDMRRRYRGGHKDESFSPLFDLWDKTLEILYVVTEGVCLPSLDYKWNVLHAIATEVNGACWRPSLMLWLAIKLYPDQISKLDDNGNLPLHIVVSQPPLSLISSLSSSSEARACGHSGFGRAYRPLNEIASDVFEILLRSFPTAVSYPNASGQLPLHIALENGWCFAEDIDKIQTKGKSKLSLLIELSPESLDVTDKSTSLLPFMIAATSATPGSSSSSSLSSLDTIFNLLKQNPTHLQLGIRPTIQETYLESKLAQLQDKILNLEDDIEQINILNSRKVSRLKKVQKKRLLKMQGLWVSEREVLGTELVKRGMSRKEVIDLVGKTTCEVDNISVCSSGSEKSLNKRGVNSKKEQRKQILMKIQNQEKNDVGVNLDADVDSSSSCGGFKFFATE